MAKKRLCIPKQALISIEKGAALALSLSGGKDSQALVKVVTNQVRAMGFPNKIFAIHAHLGRVEWPQTLAHCQKLCDELNIELVIVRREKGDLLDRWRERMEKVKGKGIPFWSSARERYCTSDMKRGPINKYLRKFDHIISVEGIRAQESYKRAKDPRWEIRKMIKTKTRQAFTWNAIHEWNIEDVWQTYGNSSDDLRIAREYYQDTGLIDPNWKFHPAYAMGNERLSCMICILGSLNDITNGIIHGPELAREMIAMEDESGFTFRQNMSLKEVHNSIVEML